MNHIIATSRSWNEYMATSLEDATGHNFFLVTKRDELTKSCLERIKPRYIFFPHWSYIVPEDIFEKYECVIFHMTDVPYGRGGSPLQNLIQRGHETTRISAIKCSKEMDAGEVYLKDELSLEGAACEIFIRASKIVEKMIQFIVENEPEPVTQQGEVTIFQRRTPSESDIGNAVIHDIDDFFDFIRMLDADGYPKAYIEIHGHTIEFCRVQKEPNKLVGTFSISKKPIA